MKQLWLFLLFFILLSGCSNSTAPMPPNGVTLISGFNGKDTLSAIGKSSVSYTFPNLYLVSIDTVEISLSYSHFGKYPITFGIVAAAIDHALAIELWRDTLTRGDRSVTIKLGSDWFTGSTRNSLGTFYEDGEPADAPPDTTKIFNFFVVGLTKK